MAIWIVIGVPLAILIIGTVMHLAGAFDEEEQAWHGDLYLGNPTRSQRANRLKTQARARSEWEQTLAELERKKRAERIQREYEARQAAAKAKV